MRVIGIDPGTATTGFAIIDSSNKKLELIDYGVITTKSTMSLPERLLIINNDISSILDKYKPDCFVIEKLFFTTNQKTAISVSEARGVLLLTASINKINIIEFTPLQIKSIITGYGKASKSQIQNAVKKRLNLAVIPKPDDAADAIAIALAYLQNIGQMVKI